MRLLHFLASIPLGILLASCGSPTPSLSLSPSPSPSGSSSSSPTPFPEAAVPLYFLRGSTLGVSHRMVSTADGYPLNALTALVAGPDATETAAGLGTDIPKGTRILHVRVTGATAVVDCSEAFLQDITSRSVRNRVSEIVYTATSTSAITNVQITVNGSTPSIPGAPLNMSRTFGRSDFLDTLPPIFLESPAVGDTPTG